MLPILIANVFYIFCLGLVIPSLPFMVLARGGETALASVIFAAFSAAAFLSQPVWGSLADRYGAKNILIASAVMTALAYFAMGLSGTVTELFAARIFAGLSAGWLASSLTYISRISDGSNRTRAMGLLGASFGIGFTLGPAASGILLQHFPYESTAFVSAAIALATGITCIKFLPDPGRANVQDRKTSLQRHFLLSMREIADSPVIKLLFFCYFITLLTFSALEGSFALWIKFLLSQDAEFLSWILTVGGIVSIVIQGGLLGRLNRRFSEKTLVLSGIFLLGLGLALMPFCGNKTLAFVPVILAAAGLGLHNPCMQSLVSQSVSQAKHGIALGSLQSCMSLARIGGSAFAGLLFITLGVINFYFTCAAVLAVIFVLIASRLVNRQEYNRN